MSLLKRLLFVFLVSTFPLIPFSRCGVPMTSECEYERNKFGQQLLKKEPMMPLRIIEVVDQTERRMRILQLRQDAIELILQGGLDDQINQTRIGSPPRFSLDTR